MAVVFIPRPDLEVAVAEEAAPAVDEVAQAALDEAQSLCPVDTGELLASLHVEDGDAPGAKRVVAGTDHWLYPEYGTSEMPAEPYLRPVIDSLGLHR